MCCGAEAQPLPRLLAFYVYEPGAIDGDGDDNDDNDDNDDVILCCTTETNDARVTMTFMHL